MSLRRALSRVTVSPLAGLAEAVLMCPFRRSSGEAEASRLKAAAEGSDAAGREAAAERDRLQKELEEVRRGGSVLKGQQQRTSLVGLRAGRWGRPAVLAVYQQALVV